MCPARSRPIPQSFAVHADKANTHRHQERETAAHNTRALAVDDLPRPPRPIFPSPPLSIFSSPPLFLTLKGALNEVHSRNTLKLLNHLAGLEKFEIVVLIPRHELLDRLLEDIAEIPVSSQRACIVMHTYPRFILIRDEQPA